MTMGFRILLASSREKCLITTKTLTLNAKKTHYINHFILTILFYLLLFFQIRQYLAGLHYLISSLVMTKHY